MVNAGNKRELSLMEQPFILIFINRMRTSIHIYLQKIHRTDIPSLNQSRKWRRRLRDTQKVPAGEQVHV